MLKKISSLLGIKKSYNNNYVFYGSGSNSANWWSFDNRQRFLAAYISIPELNEIIDYQATLFSNVKVWVEDLNGEVLKGTNLEKLIKNPNPLMSTQEYLKQVWIEYNIYGNEYNYGLSPLSFPFNADNVQNLYILPSLCTEPVLTDQFKRNPYGLELENIVGNYMMLIDGRRIPFRTETVLHKREPSTHKNNPLIGDSRISKIKYPVSTMEALYEADNVVINNLGAMGIFTNEQKDDAGFVNLNPDDKALLEEDFKNKYGAKIGRYQHIITNASLKWQQTLPNVQTLRIDEKQEKYGKSICRRFNHPIDLFLASGTFSNMKEAVKLVYNDAIIPFAEDFFNDMNDWLKTKELNQVLKHSYDHVPALQSDKETESKTLKTNNETLEKQYLNGLITKNDWRIALGLDAVNEKSFNEYYSKSED